MGTEKRERQKANRQLKLQEMAREATKQKKKRIALRYGLGIPVAIALVYGLVWLLGGTDKSGSVTAGTTTTTIAIDTTTSTATSDSVEPSTTVAETTTVPVTVAPIPTVTAAPPATEVAGNLPCPASSGEQGRVVSFPSVLPPTCIDRTKTYTAKVTTNQGEFSIALDAKAAPLTVNSFVYLARYHYFDNTLCHRIVPGFVAQCGDPTATGSGGPGYQFADELPAAGAYKLGSVVMANSGADTNGSQFFVITGDKGVQLPPNYALFGQVTDGLDTTVSAIDGLAVADKVPSKEPVIIESVTITES